MQTMEASGPAHLHQETDPPWHKRRSIAITLAVTTIGVLLIAAGLAIAGSDSRGAAAGTVLVIGDETISLAEELQASGAAQTVAVLGTDDDIGIPPRLWSTPPMLAKFSSRR